LPAICDAQNKNARTIGKREPAMRKKQKMFFLSKSWSSLAVFGLILMILISGNCAEPERRQQVSLSFQSPDPGKLRLVTQLGHSGHLYSVCFSPDADYVLTGSLDRTARLWELETGREVGRFEGHAGDVTSAAFSPDGRYVLTGSLDLTARLWVRETAREVRKFMGHTGFITSVAFSPDGRYVLTGSYDKTARLWEQETGREVRKFEGHTDLITSVAFSPDGRYVLTGSFDKTARLWEQETGEEVKKFKGHTGEILSVTFSSNGLYLLTGSGDDTARLWELETGREIRKFEGDETGFSSVALSQDGSYVVGGTVLAAYLWDVRTGKEIRKLEGHTQAISSVAFSSDGLYVLTGSGDRTARLWELETGREIRRFGGGSDLISSVAFSPDGRYVLTGSYDQEAHLWEWETGKELKRFFVKHNDTTYYGPFSVAFSPDGRYVLTGSSDQNAHLWERETGKEVKRFFVEHQDTKYQFFPLSIAFSPDGLHVLTGGADTTARLWELEIGREVRKFEGHKDGHITSVAFSPDGRYILTGSSDRTARLWELETGKELKKFEGAAIQIQSVAFSPDGRYFLTGGTDSAVYLWERETGKEVKKFEGHEAWAWITSVAFSPDGKYILTGSSDNTARLWELKTGREVRKFEGHSDKVESVAFSPDSRYVLTGSWDNTARLWDYKTGKELLSLISFRDGTWAVIDPEGRYDASNGGDVEGLHWVVGNESIALSQLKERYYEPGLLSKVMGFNKERIRDVQAFTQVALFPKIELSGPAREHSKLGIKLTNRGGGIGRVVVWINGKEIATDAREGKVAPDTSTAELSIDIASHPYLVPGKKNLIEVKAYNAEGYLSSRGVFVDYDAPGIAYSEIPTLWAIVAGVSDYSGEAIDLRYAAKDARDMATALKLGGSRLFGADKVKLQTLTTLSPDTLPTKDNLREAFKEFKVAKPWDILVVYLAGHGVAQGDEYYYLTQEARSTDLTDPAVRKRDAISSEELVEWIKKSSSNLQVMVLDTCAAGTFERKLSETRDISSDQVRAIDRMKDRTGFHVLMGSAADRVSYEATQYEQGLLTYALLEGMKGAALREQEFVDVSTLFNHAVEKVPRLAKNIGGVQSPRIAAPKGTSFDIGQLKDEDRQKIPLAQSKPFLLAPVFLNPDEGFDTLGLTNFVRKKLREESSALARGGARTLPVVYIDAEQFSGALLPSGTYSVTGDKAQAAIVLVRDQKRVADLKVEGNARDPEGLAGQIVEGIMAKVQNLK
jgi:WD40 repeat protein